MKKQKKRKRPTQAAKRIEHQNSRRKAGGGRNASLPSSDNTPYEKVGNNDPVSIADEVPFEIPESWEWVRASTLGQMIRGKGIKRTETVSDGKPCVRYGEIYTTYAISFTSTKSFIPQQLYDQCNLFYTGDIIFTLTGENKPDIAKAVAYFGSSPVAAGGDLAYWTNHNMSPLYLVYYMASPYCIEKNVAWQREILSFIFRLKKSVLFLFQYHRKRNKNVLLIDCKR